MIENGQIVCFIVGEEDIIIKKEDVVSFECVSQNIPRTYTNQTCVCNIYAVTLANGEFGSFTIVAGKCAEFILLLKK